MIPIKTLKTWNDILLQQNNLEISFQNGPEHETTSLRILETRYHTFTKSSQKWKF